MQDLDMLVDGIYEAAVVPDSWRNVLHRLGDIGGARGAILLSADPTGARWIASPGMHDDMVAYEQGRWHEKNQRLLRLMAMQHSGFLRDVDVFASPEEVQEDPQIKEFFRPRGLGWGVGTTIPVPSGDFLIVSIDRDYERGPIEREIVPHLDAIRPHLARAALISARLGMERAKTATDTLGMLGLPAAVLRRNGTIMIANALMQSLMPDVVQDRRDRAGLVSKSADSLLAQSLAAIDRNGLSNQVKSIPVAATESQSPIIVHLVPVRGSAHDIFLSASAIMIVTPVVPSKVPNAEVIQGLFDLSPAEARIARNIGQGQTVEVIADTLGVSRETIRSQLKSVLSKTGLHRQAELVSLLAGKGLPQL